MPAMPTPLSIRGLMLDAARLVESPAYYRRFLDFCAAWNVNAVIFRLTDDQGCALRFASHPELLTHRNALTPGEVGALASYGQARGVTLIPEIESFGHSRYITGIPRYAALSDKSPDGPDWANGLIPLHPDGLRILADLYAEAAALFPGPWLHGGCDEVNWGGSDHSRKLLAARSRAAVWGEYLNALNAIAREQGKELIVWGDHVLRREPEALEGMDRRIIIHDWEYHEPDPRAVTSLMERALGKGFRVIGGPALGWCRWGPRVGTGQLRNLEAFADAYRARTDARALGVIVTHWVPSRYLQNAMWDGLAYAATTMDAGGAAAREEAVARFVERHYGSAPDDEWQDVFRTLHDTAPSRRVCATEWMPPFLSVPWADEHTLATVAREGRIAHLPFDRVLGQLENRRPGVRRNAGDFEALRLTVAHLAHLQWRDRRVIEAARQARMEATSAARLIEEIAARDARLWERLEADWLDGRSRAALEELQDTFAQEPEERLHGRFMQAAAFSQTLARTPERFRDILAGAMPTTQT